jgi:hypothetical protein
MDITIGRLSFFRRDSGTGLSQKIISPAGEINNMKYSDLYMFEKENLLEQPFNWLYFIKNEWLYTNRDKIFNYSFDNAPEFQQFVEQMRFPTMNKVKMLKKERNHLLTSLDISVENIYKIILVGNYPGYYHDCDFMSKEFQPHPLKYRFIKFENGKKGAEYILK